MIVIVGTEQTENFGFTIEQNEAYTRLTQHDQRGDCSLNTTISAEISDKSSEETSL